MSFVVKSRGLKEKLGGTLWPNRTVPKQAAEKLIPTSVAVMDIEV